MALVEVHQTSTNNVPNKLVSNLYSQKQSGKYCDIKLTFGNVVMSAHACVVGSFSGFVDKVLTCGEVMSPMFGNTTTVVVPLNCDDFSCQQCAEKVLDFMYIGKIQIDDDHLDHLKIVSSGLQVSELIKICEKHSEKCIIVRKNKSDVECDTVDDAVLSNFDDANSLETVCNEEVSFHRQLKTHIADQQETLREILTSDVIPSTAVLRDKQPEAIDESLEEKEWAGMTCPKCDVTFMSNVKFQQHCSTHLGKIYTTCFVCNFASLRVPDLIKHLLEKDHGELVCSLCLYVASSNQSLKEHLQQHDHSQPFFCLTCNTRFQTRTALNSHIVKHSNETPFRCKECGRGFKWKHGLQSHMVTHTSVKKLLCDQCGFSTAHLKSFIDHKSVHSGETFKCPIADCKFKSVRKESVKQHLSTHSKEKPYQCEICGQAFSQAKNLRRHAAIHDPGVDPERCPLCTFQTTRSDKFREHFRRYHKDGHKGKTSLKAKPNLKSGNVSKGKKKSKPKKTGKSAPLSDVYLKESKAEGGSQPVCTTLESDSVNETQLVGHVSAAVPILSYSCAEGVVGVTNDKTHLINSNITPMNVSYLSDQMNVLNNPMKELIESTVSDAIQVNQNNTQIFVSDLDCNTSVTETANASWVLSQDGNCGPKIDAACNQIIILNESDVITQPSSQTVFLSSDGKLIVMGLETTNVAVPCQPPVSLHVPNYKKLCVRDADKDACDSNLLVEVPVKDLDNKSSCLLHQGCSEDIFNENPSHFVWNGSLEEQNQVPMSLSELTNVVQDPVFVLASSQNPVNGQLDSFNSPCDPQKCTSSVSNANYVVKNNETISCELEEMDVNNDIQQLLSIPVINTL